MFMNFCCYCYKIDKIRILFYHDKRISIAGGVVHTTITTKIRTTESKCTIKNLKKLFKMFETDISVFSCS